MDKLWRSSAAQVTALIIAAALVVVATAWYSDKASTVGLVGVLMGATISTAVALATTRGDRRFQLTMAALDKRLAAHQEAYAIWQEIMRTVHDRDKIGKAAMKAEEWWTNNCLYLDAASRSAFRACFIMAPHHRDLLEGPRSAEATKQVKDSWAVIVKPSQTLVAGVALPSLGEDESPLGIPGPEGK